MEFERLETAWRSPANTPDDKVRAYLMETLMRTLKARRRSEILLFAIPATAMTIFTVIMARTIAEGRMDVAREWGGLAMMAVCWLVLLGVFVAGVLLRHRSAPGEAAVLDTLKAMLAANRRARANMKLFLLMLPVFLVPMVIGVGQLHEVGKATDRNSWQMLLVFGVALTASGGWNMGRYHWVMKPEQRRLEALLEEYQG